MYLKLLIAICSVFALVHADEFTVSESNCDETYSIYDSDDSIIVNWDGSKLSTGLCTITFKNRITENLSFSQICVDPIRFKLDCGTTVLYNAAFFSTLVPDKQYSCGSLQYYDWCSSSATIMITFPAGYHPRVDLRLKIHIEDNSEVIDSIVTSVYVVIGSVIGVVVILGVIMVVVIILCCRRRRNAGTVYGPGPSTLTTGNQAYPMVAQPGYQPSAGFQQPPQGYQPGIQPQTGYQPQAGYQPQGGFQAQAGYPPPVTGYPPAPQQTYTGNQTSPDTMTEKPASAPYMDPPPYSPGM